MLGLSDDTDLMKIFFHRENLLQEADVVYCLQGSSCVFTQVAQVDTGYSIG